MTSALKISVINLTHGLLSDQEVQNAIRAINRQIAEDFTPHWNISGELRLEGTAGSDPARGGNTEDMRGDAVVYLWDEADIPNAVGYHDANYMGVPFGFVFVDIATELGENWTVTFSHEVLELLGDRQANLLVQGPHPDNPEQLVYHWREMCDAVQADIYTIDGVEVSNFVLPLYFTPDSEPGSRNDFLGEHKGGHALASFSINPGGYIGYYNPKTAEHETKMGRRLENPVIEPVFGHEVTPAYRQRRKNKARLARRGNRYQACSTDTSLAIHSKSKPFKSKSGKHDLKLKWSGEDLMINKKPIALDDQRLKAGSFAHNIYASGRTLQRHMKEEDFRELENLSFEVEPSTNKAAATAAPRLEMEVTRREDEAIIVMTETDGILLWHECTNPRARKNSKFYIPIAASLTGDPAVRGNLFAKIKKTVVRFFKHKLLKKIRKEINKSLPGYLAKHIEHLAFRKSDPLTMMEFHALPQPQNGTIAKLDKMHKPLQEGGRYLLFVHGIFSSIQGAFGDLLRSRYEDNFYNELNYDRVIGADHWTVARDTRQNALDLLGELPDNCELDIVCHSRGAGIVRCLLEHPDIITQFQVKNIDVGKVIFVAGACQGSPLALPERIGSLVNVFSILSSLSNSFFPVQLVTALLKAVQYGVKNFPGIASMSPDADIITELNKSLNCTDCQYIYMRSNYEPQSKLKTLLDEGVIDRFVFEGEMNDLVAPYEGAGTFDSAVEGSIETIAACEFGAAPESLDSVVHTRFFREREVRRQLLKHLATT